MSSPWPSSVVHSRAFRLAAVLLTASSSPKVCAFVPAASSSIAPSRFPQRQHASSSATEAVRVTSPSCAIATPETSRGVSCEGVAYKSRAVRVSARSARKWSTRQLTLAAKPGSEEGEEEREASSSDEMGADAAAAQAEAQTSSDASGSSGRSSSSEEEDAVWARAQLPMSNDMQVEQATRAVWQVKAPVPCIHNHFKFKF